MRALSVERRRGGNAANTAVVLRQLAPEDAKIRWMGLVPGSGDDGGGTFALAELADGRVYRAVAPATCRAAITTAEREAPGRPR